MMHASTALRAWSLALLAASALLSLGGLFGGAWYYGGDAALSAHFRANDLVTLVFGLPLLLAATLLARRPWVAACWTGALGYLGYNHLAAAVALAPSALALLPLAAAAGSCLLAVLVFRGLTGPAGAFWAARPYLARVSGLVLGAFGLLFIVMRAPLVFGGLLDGAARGAEFAVAVADLVFMPLWCLGGLGLAFGRGWARKAGLGLLLHAASLFFGLLLYFCLAPSLGGPAFVLDSFLAIAIMGLPFFLLLGLALGRALGHRGGDHA